MLKAADNGTHKAEIPPGQRRTASCYGEKRRGQCQSSLLLRWPLVKHQKTGGIVIVVPLFQRATRISSRLGEPAVSTREMNGENPLG